MSFTPIKLKGKYSDAVIYNEQIEQKALNQILDYCNHKAFRGTNPICMPDTHAGAGVTIGFTALLTNNLPPNVIGYDISCGIYGANLGNIDIDYEKLDKFIRNYIPSGKGKINDTISKDIRKDITNRVEKVCIIIGENKDKHMKAIGSLGGGNHFIEIGKDSDNNKWLLIHTGSRNLGHRIATYYNNMAKNHVETKKKEIRDEKNKFIGKLASEIKKYEDLYDSMLEMYNVSPGLEFLECDERTEYLENMDIAQVYADANRYEIANRIISYLKVTPKQVMNIRHNYIDFHRGIIRKGAVSAEEDANLLIPINMRDGTIIGRGKGNPSWNFSAPHGAGRIMSRTKAKENITLEEFEETMENIWTSSVSQSTVDEAPQAYKDISEILKYISDTMYIDDVIKPVYNFKAS